MLKLIIRIFIYFNLVFLFSCKNTIEVKQPLIENLNRERLLKHFAIISSDEMQGRKIGSKGNLLTQEYLISNLKQSNLLPFNGSYRHKFSYGGLISDKKVIGHNIVAFIPSQYASENYIVLTAHFDHLGHKGATNFNGADDNASGTAALLTIAQKLSKDPLMHNILIIFTDGEEQNLKGSKAFLENNPTLIPKIKLNINLDMLAGSEQSTFIHYLSRDLDKIMSSADKNLFEQNAYSNVKVIKGFRKNLGGKNHRVNWLKASDHYAFHKNDIPFIYYGVGLHKNYHTSKDTYKNANKDLYVKSTNLIHQKILFIDHAINKVD